MEYFPDVCERGECEGECFLAKTELPPMESIGGTEISPAQDRGLQANPEIILGLIESAKIAFCKAISTYLLLHDYSWKFTRRSLTSC